MQMQIERAGQAIQVSLRLILSNASRAMLFLMFVSPAFADGCYTVGGTQTQTSHPVYWDYSKIITLTVTVPANIDVCSSPSITDNPLNFIKVDVAGEGLLGTATLSGAYSSLHYNIRTGGFDWEITILMNGGFYGATLYFPIVIRKNDYSISLSGGTEVEPSSTSSTNTLPVIATVKDQSTGQPPTSPVKVHISLKVEPNSGGHEHGDSSRPRGGIANVGTCPSDSKCWEKKTDGKGAVVFNFNAPEASGTHTITATCDGCSNTATKSVDVKMDRLEIIPDSPFYTFIGKTDKHRDNHYLTPEAATVLWRIAVSYQVEQQFKLQDPATGRFTVTPPVLHVNDASLRWGGLFDISGKWMSPHVEHRRGTVVDIRANTLPTAIPTDNLDEFMVLAVYYGADAFLETPSADLRHFHLRLLNREE